LDIFKKKKSGGGGLDWIDKAQERNRLGPLVKAVMNFQVPRNAEEFFE